MTVLIMYEWEKKEAASLYKTRFHTLAHLARYYNVSTSTMRAALIEQGVIKTKPVLSVDEHLIIEYMRKHNITLARVARLYNASMAIGA